MHRDVHLAIVFNTLWALLTQKDQVQCLRSVAGHPTEDGALLTRNTAACFLVLGRRVGVPGDRSGFLNPPPLTLRSAIKCRNMVTRLSGSILLDKTARCRHALGSVRDICGIGRRVSPGSAIHAPPKGAPDQRVLVCSPNGI
jgi:hypothetical protein